MARCKDCDASIRFLRLESGRKMPVDVDPHIQGNVAVTDEDRDLGKVLAKGEGWVGNRYRPHWMTCPNAAMFRDKRRA